MKSYLDYILSGRTQGSFVSATALAPNKSDPSVWVLPNLWSALI
jgi:hypothetical protein